jgi:bisanhydrobacterioruberin hydratase
MDLLLSLKNNNTRIRILILLIFYSVGIAGLSLIPEQFAKLTPVNLLISVTILFWGQYFPSIRILFHLGAIWILSFLLEMAGTNSGLIFGTYGYGNALGPKLAGTPLIIGLNWIITCYCSIQVAGMVFGKKDGKNNIFLFSLLSAFFMVLLDMLIEPVAPKLDFWAWMNDAIPIQNFLAWLFFGWLFCFWMIKLNLSQRNSTGIYLYFIQIVFFLILNIIL